MIIVFEDVSVIYARFPFIACFIFASNDIQHTGRSQTEEERKSLPLSVLDQAKKQEWISRSTAEAEYRSMATTAGELMWIQSLLSELGYNTVTPVIYCDNLSTVMLSRNPVLHSRTKHIELDLFWVREKVLHKKLVVEHVPGDHQVADILTKPLSHSRFSVLRDKLNVTDRFQIANQQKPLLGFCPVPLLQHQPP